MSDRSPLLHEIGPPLAWAALGGLACWVMIGLEPNMLEEGILLHIAQRMVGGDHIYRDIAIFIGPLPFELLALLFRVFGSELMVARAIVVVMHASGCAAAYALGREARSGVLAHAAAACVAAAPILLFPLLSLYFYATMAFHLSLVAAWACVRALESSRWAVAAGALIALTALCKQTVGAALAVALFVALAACAARGQRAARLSALAAGGALVAVATLALYAGRGDLGALFHSLIVMPLGFSESFDAAFMNLWPPGEFRDDIFADRARYVPSLYGFRYSVYDDVGFAGALTTQLLYAAPFAALAATLAARLRGPLPAAAWIHAAALAALTTNLFPRTDWGHLVFALPSAFLQPFLLLGAGELRPRLARAGAALWIAGLALASIAAASWLHGLAGLPMYGPRVPLRPVSTMLKDAALPRAIEVLRRKASPGEPIFVARSEPLVYFATDTTNPTPYPGLIPGMGEEQQRTILAALPDVRFVVMSDIDQPAYLYYSDALPGVQAHLERHYHVTRAVAPGWINVLERGVDRGPTAVDLIELRPRASAWLRDASGALTPASEAIPRMITRQNRRPLPHHIGARGGGIDFELEVPEGARFQADIGLWEAISLRTWHKHTRDLRMRVSVARQSAPGDREFHTLVERLVLFGREQGLRWQPIEADLSDYAGERVVLRLEGVPGNSPLGQAIAWWGSPRLALLPP